MSLVLITAAVALLTGLWYFVKRSPHPVDQVQGPPTLPFFGNVLMFVRPLHEVFLKINELAEQYKTIYRTWNTKYIPIITPLEPKYVEVTETVLSSADHITKSHEYDFIAEWLGYGLLISKGAKWHSRRKLLTPAFHFSILEQFVPVFCDKTRILVEKLRSAATANPDGVDIVPYVTRCALDIICQTAMGQNVHAQDGKDSSYVAAIYEINDLLVYRILRPWLYPTWIFRISPSGRKHAKCIKTLHDFSNKIIRERKEELKTLKQKSSNDSGEKDDTRFGIKKQKTAFLDLLLQASEHDPSLTDEEIRSEVDTFTFEGHDTTAMGMSWTIYYLSANPEIQSRCVEELEEIFCGSDRDPSMTDLSNMKYLERVIKESLRLKPSVVMIARNLNQNLKLEGFDAFPPNTNVNINIYNIHRNPEIYPDPEKFDPDRFLPENCVGRHPYAYIPFSAGPRNCIGQKFAMLEMKTTLSSILRQFRLESCDSEFYGIACPDLILRPMNGLKTRLFDRKMT